MFGSEVHNLQKNKIGEGSEKKQGVREWLENRPLMNSWRISVYLTYQREI